MLVDHLYCFQPLEKALLAYVDELQKSKKPQDLAHANLWRQYLSRMRDEAYLAEVVRFSDSFFYFLQQKYPRLAFSMEGRRKSVLSTENKILRYLKLEKPLDYIQDFHAFRIIIDNGKQSLKVCYQVAQDLIEFALLNGFNPTAAPPRIGTIYQYVPSNSFHTQFPYKDNIKDYMAYPKANGYQSIHIVFKDDYGRAVEWQIRTVKQHEIAEKGDADHVSYKQQTKLLKYDPAKIQIYGYHYVEAFGDVIDIDGIEKPNIIYPKKSSQNSPGP